MHQEKVAYHVTPVGKDLKGIVRDSEQNINSSHSHRVPRQAARHHGPLPKSEGFLDQSLHPPKQDIPVCQPQEQGHYQVCQEFREGVQQGDKVEQ